MEKEIRNSLNEAIGAELDLLANEKTVEARSKAIENLTKLHKLRIDEAKIELEAKTAEADQRQKKDQMTLDQRYKELQMDYDREVKERQLDSQEKDRWTNIALQFGIAVGGWIMYDIWNRRGLRFEEVGTITSTINRNLFSKLLPRK